VQHKWIRPLDRVEPNPGVAEAYTDAYERYRSLYPHLKPHFAEQAEGLGRG
jgi:sugar (pentulose or hexulose) kinase